MSPTELEVQKAYFNGEMSAAKEKYLEVEKNFSVDEKKQSQKYLKPRIRHSGGYKKMLQEAKAAVDDIFPMRIKKYR